MPTPPANPVNSHSQFEEDVLLSRIFADTTRGVCLEVGAFDGITGSPTYVFEQKGWTAVLVEPLPEMAAPIRARRRGPFFPVAAGPREETVSFLRARRDPATSSLGGAHWQENLYQLRAESTEVVTVPQLTLDRILADAGVDRLDFASIDVEGHELGVLQGWDLDRWRPRVLILEDNARGLDSAVRLHLAARGYVCFHRTGVNDWYARRDDASLARPLALCKRALWRSWRRLRPTLLRLAPSSLRGFGRRRLSLGD